jgi:hypothetical protein
VSETTGPLWKKGKWFFGTLGGMFLGGVLLVAAWAKALDPSSFAELIRQEGLDLVLSAEGVAMIALALEVALGAALLLGVRRLWVLAPACLLVVFFVALNARAYWRAAHGLLDDSAGCGCFGNLVERTPAEAFWQDLGLLVPALLLAFLGRPTGAPFPSRRVVATVILTVGAVIFTWKSPQLPLDDLATRLRPGVTARGLCAGRDDTRVCLQSLIPELSAGRHVVVLADLDDPEFGEAVPQLNDYALAGRGPTLWALAATTPEAKLRFFFSWGPSFDIREAPDALLRAMVRTLPRSFVVADGEVVATYSGLPPLAELAAEATEST